jgi:hypothetical protein
MTTASKVSNVETSPLNRIVGLLHRLEASLDSSSAKDASAFSPSASAAAFAASLEESKKLLRSALSVAEGLDPYLSEISSDAHPLVGKMMEDTAKIDWSELHRKGEIGSVLAPDMCSGPLEAVALQQFARITKVKNKNKRKTLYPLFVIADN